MKENLIAFETAKLAKEKEFGYDFGGTEYVPSFYCEEDNNETLCESEMQQEDACRCDYYLRPTQSLLQKWLREKHKIHIWVEPQRGNNPSYMLSIYNSNNNEEYFMADYGFLEGSEQYEDSADYMWYNSYEEALEIGLQEALKLI